MPYADGYMGHGGSMLGKYDALEVDTFRPKAYGVQGLIARGE